MNCSCIGIIRAVLLVCFAMALGACSDGNRTGNIAPNDVSGFQSSRMALKEELAECEEDCHGDLLCVNKCRRAYKTKARKLLNKPKVSPSGAIVPPMQ